LHWLVGPGGVIAGDAPPLPGNLPVLEAGLDGMAETVGEGARDLGGDEDVPHRVAALVSVPGHLAEVEVLAEPHAGADAEPIPDGEGPSEPRHEIDSQPRLALTTLPDAVALAQELEVRHAPSTRDLSADVGADRVVAGDDQRVLRRHLVQTVDSL